MQRDPVRSSNLASVGYDGETQTLEVEFRNGRVYQYADVPSDEVARLMGSDSIGSTFAARIRNNYEATEVTE